MSLAHMSLLIDFFAAHPTNPKKRIDQSYIPNSNQISEHLQTMTGLIPFRINLTEVVRDVEKVV